MVFKLALASIALAASVSAANFKRVTCPDGNVTSNAAVRGCCFGLRPYKLMSSVAVLCILPLDGRSSAKPFRERVRRGSP